MEPLPLVWLQGYCITKTLINALESDEERSLLLSGLGNNSLFFFFVFHVHANHNMISF